ncbi:MAG: methyl-accepting chemotaxis protein [Candidatus Brocadia sp.]
MKFTLNKKLLLIGILPSIAIIFFVYTIATEKIGIKIKADKIGKLCQYIVNASELVHELQKERGASAAYVGSGGNKMKDILVENKRNTDRTLASFQQYITSFDTKQFGTEFTEKISSTLNQLNELTAKRTAVVGLSISKEEAVRYYTTIIANFIKSFEYVALQANHAQISGPAYACVNFISAKELAGVERATLSSIVAANKAVETQNLANWLSAWKGQERLMNSFEYLASQEVVAFYKSNHKGQVVEKVSEIRDAVLEKAGEGNFGITAEEVYEAFTKRINVLKEIEDYQANNIRGISEKISSEARNGIIIYSIIGGAALAIVLSLTFIFTARIMNLLKGLVGELTTGSSQVLSASEQISASSQSLSEATSEQAASIEETSSTMEEISSMTKQNADNAAEASKLAKLCNNTVEHGSATVTEMNDAMKKISESSGKIADIIKIIEGIAFQTNLLALNAAVEAARAGEHGRGFAVVADEVRNLAQRSSTAAKDITALITDSVKKAEIGTELVKKTREVFSNMVTQVKKVTDLVNEIATASEEQTHGIEQISKAIQQLDQVVQQNAANAEETAAASEELSAQAQGLNALVDKIAAEVNMEGDTGVKPAVVKKKETGQLKAKRAMTTSNKKISSSYQEDTPPEGNGKELVLSGVRSDRLIPMSNDDFKDF